jgi:[NiFe] hydrogenase assembly HybE family chaperone
MNARFEGGWNADSLAPDAQLECGVCWAPYDPALGDPERGVAPGTAFAALPEGWRCPDCDSGPEKFLLVEAGAAAPAPTRPALERRLGQLLAAYREADMAMASLPIYNPRLAIEAVGFRAFGEGFLGALVTPWFLNLVLLPQERVKEGPASGAVRALTFASGIYPFAAYRLDGVGAFEALSLFSPMQEFESQEAARLAAEAALAALFAPAVRTEPAAEPAPSPSRRTLLLGRRRAAEAPPT